MKISGILFAIVLLAFLLAFMVVINNDQKIATITGYKAAFGGNVETDYLDNTIEQQTNQEYQNLPIDGDTLIRQETRQEVTRTETTSVQSRDLKASFWGILAILAALAGLITALMLDRDSYLIPLIAAIIGFIALIFLPGNVKNQFLGFGDNEAGMNFNTQFGYWLSMLAFVAAAAMAYLAGRDKPVIARDHSSNVNRDRKDNKNNDSVSYSKTGTSGAMGSAYGNQKIARDKADLDRKFDKMADGAKDTFADVRNKTGDAVDKLKDTSDKIDDNFDDMVDKAKNKDNQDR